ncbi:hypothetical protein MVI01_74640 [Myxococcus virescens]|uniref:Uncharacterized protein n=1 Tax=Myxococcus virescens TaxID=83456 RepID=A0A511HQ05_9BACT|nr:hypothetical protein MVI01_74640 [Myxococcus virescens]
MVDSTRWLLSSVRGLLLISDDVFGESRRRMVRDERSRVSRPRVRTLVHARDGR